MYKNVYFDKLNIVLFLGNSVISVCNNRIELRLWFNMKVEV